MSSGAFTPGSVIVHVVEDDESSRNALGIAPAGKVR
jgi:hypothetical protein